MATGSLVGAASNGQDFIDLWRHRHDYLTKTKRLHKLIWVSAGAREPSPWIQPRMKYYPGEAYVDIVALDMCTDTLDEAAISPY